jgi:predicted lipase
MKNKKKSPGTSKKEIKNMMLRAGFALKHEYFLEASWIISAILEKRVKYILEKVEPQKSGILCTFDQDIKRIKHLRLTANQPMLTDHFTIQMIDALRIWKNQRNEVMKDMLVRHITKERMERLANDGIRILKEWNASVKAVKSALKKKAAPTK